MGKLQIQNSWTSTSKVCLWSRYILPSPQEQKLENVNIPIQKKQCAKGQLISKRLFEIINDNVNGPLGTFFTVWKFQMINLQFLIYYSDSLPRWMLALLPYPFLHGQYEGNHPYLSKMSHGVGQMQAVVSSDFKGSLDVDMQDSQRAWTPD